MYPDSRILEKFLILSQPQVPPELTGEHVQKVTRHLKFSSIESMECRAGVISGGRVLVYCGQSSGFDSQQIGIMLKDI